jgi:uncharacterized membrane protein YfcA
VVRDLLIGFGVGAFSGAFGVGGGIILVPTLVLLWHLSQKRAQATSLVMVAMAAASGAITYAIAGSVVWNSALYLLMGGLAGSLVGSAVVHRTADLRLQFAFGVLLVAVSISLLLPRGETTSTVDSIEAPFVVLIAAGVVMGLLSALFGIGGGLVIIPFLVLAYDYPQQAAAGTALAVMVPIALLGAWRQSRSGATDWPLGFRIGIGSIPGSVVGAAVALSLSGSIVRFAFAVLVALIGIQMVRSAVLTKRSES